MAKAQTVTATEEVIDMAAVDELLGDLDLGDEVVEHQAAEEMIEAIVEEEAIADVLEGPADEDLLADMEIELERSAVYEAQDASTTEVNTDAEAEDETVEVEKPATAAKAAKTPRTSTPRTPKDLSAVGAEFFVLEGDPAALTDLDANKAAVLTTKPGQKKIAEKFENLFQAIAGGKKPSVFVTTAYALLKTKGEVTSSEIVAAYKVDGYTEGTARSQAGQVMSLFATVKLATRSGQSLKLNADSKLAERLNGILGL